jgi:hypothetical protein
VASASWTKVGFADHYRLSLSTNGGASFPTVLLASASTSPVAWTAPNITSNTVRLRVEAMSAANTTIAADDSDADFYLTQTTVTVTAPNGGETLYVGATQAITWSHAGSADRYRISLSADSGATYGTTIADSTAASPYAWTVPDIPTTHARVQITALNAAGTAITTAASAADFTIAKAPTVSLQDPNGGEVLLAGGLFDVLWSATNTPDHYRLKLSTDGGNSYPITVLDPVTVSPWTWTVTNAPTTRGRLKIEAVSAQGTVLASAFSAADFTIDKDIRPTTQNRTPLSRLQAGATANLTLSFYISHTLSSDLVVTFPAGFEVLSLPTEGSSCLSNYRLSPDHLTITADKSNCPVGPLNFSGATVLLPSVTGVYDITWVNDDPGHTSVPIIVTDQVGITASVDPFMTFDVGAQPASSACDGTFSGSGGVVPLGALSTASVASSDALSVPHVCARLSTNATGGAVVSVRSQNAGLKSATDWSALIPSVTSALAPGTAGYGLCVGSGTPDSGADLTDPVSAAPARQGSFADSCSASAHAVGALTTGDQPLWSVAGPSQNAFTRLYLKAAVSPTTPAYPDYADTLTFTAVSTF